MADLPDLKRRKVASTPMAVIDEAIRGMEEDLEEAAGPSSAGPSTAAAGPSMPSRNESAQSKEEYALALLAAAENAANAAAVEVMDLRALKKLVLTFERKLRDNLAARIKYADQPEKFMDSEIELDEEVKKLNALATAPELYPDFVRLGSIQSLVGLLGHENTDISIDVVELLSELTDGDVVTDSDQEALELANALVDVNVLESLVQNLHRLEETIPDEAQCVHNTLGTIENLIEIKPEVATLVCEKTKILKWLLTRIKAKECDANKLYASEMIAILLQGNAANQKRLGNMGGVDALLQALAFYKGRTPAAGEEEEMVENFFDALCSMVMPVENKLKFVKAEGLELMVIIIKQAKLNRYSALRVLDFSMTNFPPACERFVEVLGLKTVFAVFMGKAHKGKKSDVTPEEEEGRALSIIASLGDGLDKPSLRERFASKFVEAEHEKCDRLMELYDKYAAKVRALTRRMEEEPTEEEEDMDEEELYLLKLDGGLFSLQGQGPPGTPAAAAESARGQDPGDPGCAPGTGLPPGRCEWRGGEDQTA
eukprot:jgi/Mesvir1/13793/Mv15956-RA.2